MSQNPLTGDIHPRRVAQMMQDTSQVADMIRQTAPGMEVSPAQVMADIINVQRADTKRLAECHDVDVSIQMMSEQRAADLIAGVIDGNGVEIIRVFNEIAEKRDRILRELLSEDEHDEFMAAKSKALYTDSPDRFEAEEDE